ncbi:MAG: PilN domain-containing protein [Bryobacteraceae bacterium]
MKKLFAFGSGVGISIEGARGAESLHITAVRVRPTGVTVRGGFVIEDYRNAPAAEWGAAYTEMTGKLGLQHVAATVLLPRHEVILRLISLPGVADKDLDAAVAFQVDGLHPYDEADVVTAWGRLEGSDSVAVAIARRELIDGYTTLFAEAGVKLAGFTCTGAAVHSGLRLLGNKPAGDVFAIGPLDSGIEIYGESASKPLFSAAFELAADGSSDRAVALAAAELRFETVPVPVELSGLLGAESARSYAAALTSACPMISNSVNLLPLDQRQGRSAWQWVPTVALGAAVLLAAIGLALFPGYRNGSYLETLNKEISKVQPLAARAAAMDKEIESARARTLLLDKVRLNSKSDMDVLAAMTALLAPPTWLQSMDVSAKQVGVTGETDQAEPLLKIIDQSPLFESSEFASPPSRALGSERFNLRTKRTETRP